MRTAWLAAAAIASSLSILSLPADATESDEQLWATGRVHHPIGQRFAVSFLAQGRFADDMSESDAWLVRPAVDYRLWESVFVGAGYDYFRLIGRSEENRFWQEAALPLRFGDLVVGNRARIEQRWIEGVSGVVARFRYRIRCAHPIARSPAYLVFANELFVNLNDRGEGPKQGFEQNRLGGSLGIHVGRRVRAELGYQWRHLDLRSSEKNDHVLTLNLFVDTRGKKRTAPEQGEAHH